MKCPECDIEQPEQGTLHLEECPHHRPDVCPSCLVTRASQVSVLKRLAKIRDEDDTEAFIKTWPKRLQAATPPTAGMDWVAGISEGSQYFFGKTPEEAFDKAHEAWLNEGKPRGGLGYFRGTRTLAP